MKVYNKNDVDVTFSNWFMDLEQLTSFDAIPVPKGTTNGEIIMAMFPDYKFSIYGDWVHIEFKARQFSFCPTEFWNAPYKKG